MKLQTEQTPSPKGGGCPVIAPLGGEGAASGHPDQMYSTLPRFPISSIASSSSAFPLRSDVDWLFDYLAAFATAICTTDVSHRLAIRFLNPPALFTQARIQPHCHSLKISFQHTPHRPDRNNSRCSGGVFGIAFWILVPVLKRSMSAMVTSTSMSFLHRTHLMTTTAAPSMVVRVLSIGVSCRVRNHGKTVAHLRA